MEKETQASPESKWKDKETAIKTFPWPFYCSKISWALVFKVEHEPAVRMKDTAENQLRNPLIFIGKGVDKGCVSWSL